MLAVSGELTTVPLVVFLHPTSSNAMLSPHTSVEGAGFYHTAIDVPTSAPSSNCLADILNELHGQLPDTTDDLDFTSELGEDGLDEIMKDIGNQFPDWLELSDFINLDKLYK